MKAYIITSSLNIDNVLSSESISPVSLYQSSTFGYKCFEKIKGLDFPDDQIVLFDFIPYFEIVDSERSNYPIVLEIEDDCQLNDSSLRDVCGRFFVTGKTIYVNPFNCRILFFSSSAIRELDLKCSDSKTNKLYKFYHKSLIDKKYAFDISKTDLSLLQDVCQNRNDDLAIEADRINKRKGFLYAWYLGSGKSVKPEFAKMRAVELEMCDYISAMKNNNGIGTEQYRTKLEALDAEYKKYDPNISLANSLWEEKVFSFCSNRAEFDKFVEQVGGEKLLKNNFLKFNNISVRKSIPVDFYDEYESELIRYTEFLCSKQTSSYELYDEGGVSDTLFKKLVAHIINGKISLETVRLDRIGVTMDFVKQIKFFVEENNRQWGDSEECSYLKSLVMNINEALPFDFSATKNIVLKSVAAFLLKGNDYGDMMSYLQYNAMEDYRYVLGFWGAACGYVDMSRSITKSLFESDDIDRIENVYKHIYYQLHGYDLQGSLDKLNAASAIPSKMNETKIEEVAVDQELIIPECLQSLFDLDDFNKMKPEARNWYKEKTLELWQNFGQITKGFVNELKKLSSDPMVKGKGTKGKWKDCVKFLEPKKETRQKQNDLFNQDSMIRRLPCCKDLSEDKLSQLEYWWDIASSKYPDNKDERISYFINLCRKEGDGRSRSSYQALFGFFTSEIAEQFRKELKERD